MCTLFDMLSHVCGPMIGLEALDVMWNSSVLRVTRVLFSASCTYVVNGLTPGVPLTSIYEMRLRLAAYAARYFATVGRLIDENSMSWQCVKHFKTMQKIIKNHAEPENLPEISKRITIVKALDLVEEYLRGVLGVEKVPLSYIIRKEVLPI